MTAIRPWRWSIAGVRHRHALRPTHPLSGMRGRERGCPLRCAHDYGEAAQALAHSPRCPTWSSSTCTSRSRGEAAAGDKSSLPRSPRREDRGQDCAASGSADSGEAARQHPTLPVVMLTTLGRTGRTGRRSAGLPVRERGGRQPEPGAEISRALAVHHTGQEGHLLGTRPAMAELRRQLDTLARSPLPLLIEAETGPASFLAEQVIHPRSGARGPWSSPICRPCHRRCWGRTSSARDAAPTGAVEDHAGVFEQARRHAVPRRDHDLDLELQRSCCWCSNAAR